MKSERQIRMHIATAKSRLQRKGIGVRERAAAEAVISSLQWIVNKTGFDPESNIMDAMIDDHLEEENYE